MNPVQYVATGHIDTHAHTHTNMRAGGAVAHCGSRLVQLLLGSDINTEQIGGDLQPLLFDLSSSCHISWHCPPATPRGAGRTGMASTCLPGLFSVFFSVQLIPLCPLHGFSSANYKSPPNTSSFSPPPTPVSPPRHRLAFERPSIHQFCLLQNRTTLPLCFDASFVCCFFLFLSTLLPQMCLFVIIFHSV